MCLIMVACIINFSLANYILLCSPKNLRSGIKAKLCSLKML